jgi:putative hemolysin
MSPVAVPATSLGVTIEPGPGALLVLLVLFSTSYFFSGTETAMFSLQQVDRDRIARMGRTGARLNSLLERKAALITTILMGNEFANIALATVAAALVDDLFPTMPWLSVVVLTPTLVLVSEITPKVIAFRFRSAWAALATWPLSVFGWGISPFRWGFTTIVSALARLFGVPPSSSEETWAKDELMVYVDRSAAVGELDPMERDIIEAVFELDELPVQRLMTPRPDMFTLPLDIPWDQLMQAASTCGHSRIPVWGDDDDIVGVLIVKDLLRYRKAPLEGPRQLRSILLPPTFVLVSKPADELLREFLEQRVHMAFVVDEYGTLVGLVTLDDLLYELIGDDESSEDSEIAQVRPNVITVRASIDVEDFSEETGIELPDGEHHTLGGFLWHQLGRLPRVGDDVEYDGHRFVVAEMEGRRIAEVMVRVSEEAV